jgi:predicted  nucleic acid-binding Zn-ribbon protein
MSQAQILYSLQQIDSEIRAKKKRLGEVLQAQKEPVAVSEARRRAEAIDAQLQTQRSAHKALTLELASLTEKARQEEQRLYSGTVRNTKELADLQHEVESLGRRRAALENEELEALMRVEETQAQRAAVEEEIGRLTAGWQSSVGSYKQEQQVLALRLNELLGKREQTARLLEPRHLQEYDRLTRMKGGLAVVKLVGNKCQGCQVTISASTVRLAQQGNVVACDSCDRLLFPT